MRVTCCQPSLDTRRASAVARKGMFAWETRGNADEEEEGGGTVLEAVRCQQACVRRVGAAGCQQTCTSAPAQCTLHTAAAIPQPPCPFLAVS